MLSWLRSKGSTDGRDEAAAVAFRASVRGFEDALRRAESAEAENTRALTERLDRLRDEASETNEALKKLARSFGRTALRVEEIERRVASLDGASPVAPDHEALFDALDLLDRALDTLDRAAAPELAAGLDGVQARLVRHLEGEGYSRLAPLGEKPDGASMRVVGAVTSGRTEGTIVQVVRAAIRRGQRLVREGEVITARGSDVESGRSV